jgi:hypothetical protein
LNKKKNASLHPMEGIDIVSQDINPLKEVKEGWEL